MEKAINAYHNVTVSPEFRNLERMREDARYNEAAALRHAQQEIIDKLKSGKSPEEIIKEYDSKHIKQ